MRHTPFAYRQRAEYWFRVWHSFGRFYPGHNYEQLMWACLLLSEVGKDAQEGWVG